MKLSAYSIFAFVILCLTACGGGNDKEQFTITAELDVPDQSYLYFWQEEHKKGISVDSVITEEGKAVFKGTCDQLAHIEIFTEAGERVVSFYAAKGNKIKLKGSIAAPYEIAFSGTPEIEEVGRFRNENSRLLQQLHEGEASFYAHLGDTAREKQLSLCLDTLHTRVIDFARSHPASYASTVLIYDYLLAPGTVKVADSLLRSLAPEAKPVSLLAKAELFIADTQKNPVGKMLPYMTFRTPDDSVINTGGFRRRTTLFTVWASYDSLSRRQMQVVRELREKHSRYHLNVVSVALDSDESAWREVLRSDTLTGWPQCILKEGWNATQVENLGIQMLPATFVINGNGRIVAKNLYDDALIEAVDKSVEEVGEDKMLDQMAPSRKRRR